MTEVITLNSVAQALTKGRAAVKANFIFENPDEDERNYTCQFNSYWNGKGHELSSLLSKFLAASYRAETHSAQELKVDPGLSVTQDVVHTWRQITTKIYPKFVADMSGMNEKLFSHPEIKAEMSAPNKKKQRDKQLSAFNKIQEEAVVKLQELDEFITYQVELRFNDFKVKVKGVEFSRV